MSNDIGAITDAELARNGVILGRGSLLLHVHKDTYVFPIDYEKVPSPEVLKLEGKHQEAESAIQNDGNNPMQLEAVRQNYAKFLEARKMAMNEADLWNGAGVPEKPSRLYAPPWG